MSLLARHEPPKPTSTQQYSLQPKPTTRMSKMVVNSKITTIMEGR
jgi:hypothetical protein